MNNKKSFAEAEQEVRSLLVKLNIDENVSASDIVEILQNATRFFKKEEKEELRGNGLVLA